MATHGRSLHALLGGGAGTPLANSPFSAQQCHLIPAEFRRSLTVPTLGSRFSRRRAAVAEEERLCGGCGGRYGGVVRLRARRLQLPLGPGQRPATPRRHPLLLG